MISSGSKTWKFNGGYNFRLSEGWPSGDVEDVPPPERVVISYQYSEPLVSEGDSVKTGQPIARPGEDAGGAASPYHATVTGTVESVEENLHRGKITISRSGNEEWHEMGPADQDSPDALRERLYESGVSAQVPGGLPTGHASSVVELGEESGEVEHLVLPLSTCQPFEMDPVVLLHGHAQEFRQGVEFLASALGSPQIHVAGTAHGLSAAPGDAVEGLDAEVHTVTDRYPGMSPRMLSFLARGKPKVASNTAIEDGVAVVDMQTVLAFYDAVVNGKATVERVVALGGKGFKNPRHLRVRIGTPLSEVLSDELDESLGELRLVRGGLMRGIALTDEEKEGSLKRGDSALAAVPEEGGAIPWKTVVTAFFDGVVQDASLHGPRQACISCSRCVEHCPVQIHPYVFHRLALRELVDESAEMGLERCIQCGTCTLVCPAKIELLDEIQYLKVMLAEEKEML